MTIHFDNPTPVTFSVDEDQRTITGLAVPYGKTATSQGMKYSFPKGSIPFANAVGAPLLWAHDPNKPIGRITEFTEKAEGIYMTARIAATAFGDEILTLCKEGAISGLSAGFAQGSKFRAKTDGIQYAVDAPIQEVSACTFPAFIDARINAVFSDDETNKETTMENDETVETVETPSVSLSADDVRSILADELKANEKRPVVPAGRTDGAVQFQVTEEPLYRFSGNIAGKHDFSQDIIAATTGDREALARVSNFMNENLLAPRFVDTDDTRAVNPTKYRADLFKDEGPAQPTPLYDFFHKGSLSDVTPFSYSKLVGAGDLLDDHTEGVEPDPGYLSVEMGATVTPTPMSGKIFITREVHDQQGNPAISGLIWSKFQRAFAQMLEEKTYDTLVSGTYGNFGPSISTGADGKVIGDAIEDGIVGLQFTPDGYRYTRLFGHVDMYTKLVSAKDSTGRKLFPILAPSNADGTADVRFGHVNVAGLRVDPTWTLGTSSAGASAAAGVSYLADANAVHVWNSGLLKLDRLNEGVAGYEIGAWAYFAGHVYDATGIKKLSYDLS